MPRKLRVQYPDAIYHVMSRGNDKQNVFRADVDWLENDYEHPIGRAFS